MLKRGFIRPSQSPAGSTLFFIRQKDKTRPVVDYRALNEITIKDRGPTPLTTETLDRLRSAKIFTKIDLRDAYHQIRIKEGDEWKTAFRTRDGHFAYLVMPFGLCNAPATFQRFITNVPPKFVDRTCVVYLDDILVYSKNEERHPDHVREVIVALRDATCAIKAEKCKFHAKKLDFLGYLVSDHGIQSNPAKIQAVLEWREPNNVTELQSFLGFRNFLQRFIKGYSEITVPLTELTRKDVRWHWDPPQQTAFERLKEAFTTAPVLAHFDPELSTVVETDASDHKMAAVLSQVHDKRLRPVAYMSKKFSSTKANYGIYKKELVAIVTAFKKWAHYLRGTKHTIEVRTEHRNLQYFKTVSTDKPQQARWAIELEEFDFKIKFIEGKTNGKPDALTRMPGATTIR
jgi:hypothetical protein